MDAEAGGRAPCSGPVPDRVRKLPAVRRKCAVDFALEAVQLARHNRIRATVNDEGLPAWWDHAVYTVSPEEFFRCEFDVRRDQHERR